MRIGIIGAGIFGLASALALRERSHEVCLFEQDTHTLRARALH